LVDEWEGFKVEEVELRLAKVGLGLTVLVGGGRSELRWDSENERGREEDDASFFSVEGLGCCCCCWDSAIPLRQKTRQKGQREKTKGKKNNTIHNKPQRGWLSEQKFRSHHSLEMRLK
jgi:hypothetical protein